MEKEQAIDYLHPGSVIYTKIERVAASGMSRCLSCYIALSANDYYGAPYIYNITHLVCHATNYTCTKDGYLRIGGCGMDMGFKVVYDLSYVLFKDRYALKQVWL